MSRLGTIAVASTAALVLATEAAAVRIGPDLDANATGSSFCTTAPFCTTLQTRMAEGMTRAPVSGVLTQYRMKEPIGTFSLQVLRRIEGNEFTSIRSSSPVGRRGSPTATSWPPRRRLRRAGSSSSTPG